MCRPKLRDIIIIIMWFSAALLYNNYYYTRVTQKITLKCTLRCCAAVAKDRKLEMIENDFLHSHSLPLPCSQFTFLPIPILHFVTIFHSHRIPTRLFSFLPIPIFKQSFNRLDIDNFWPFDDWSLFVVESKTDHDSQDHAMHCWTSQSHKIQKNTFNGTQMWPKNNRSMSFSKQNISLILHQPMGICSYENKPIPIPMQVVSPFSSYFHSQFCHQFPFPWDSYGTSIPTRNLIPMVISTANLRQRYQFFGCAYYRRQ